MNNDNEIYLNSFKDTIQRTKVDPIDIEKIEEYLHKNDFGFVDKMMVMVVDQKERDICNAMGQVLIKYDIHVDEERLKKWAELCMSLETLPIEVCQDIALRNKLEKLKRKNTILANEVEMLKDEILNLKRLTEILGWRK